MKKHFIILFIAALTAVTASAQHAIGIQVGYASPILRLNSPASFNDSQSKLSKNILKGVKIGFVYDGTIIRGFGLSLGLNYTFGALNGSWNDYNYLDEPEQRHVVYNDGKEQRTQYKYHQGEVFVDWQYKFEIAKETYIIVYTGPTIQVGFLNTKDQFRDAEGSALDLKYPVSTYPSQMDSHLSHLNVTWGLGAGFQYRRVFLRGGYDFGIINPYKKQTFDDLGYANDDRITRGRIDQWQIKVGFYFWYKTK